MSADLKIHINHIRACNTTMNVLLQSFEVVNGNEQSDEKSSFDIIILMSKEISSALDEIEALLKYKDDYRFAE